MAAITSMAWQISCFWLDQILESSNSVKALFNDEGEITLVVLTIRT